MPYRRTSAVQARLDAKQTEILRAATALLSEHGYRGLSMAAVGSAAGVATGSVYTHFADKTQLVTAIFRTVVNRELDAVNAAVARSGDPVEKVTGVVETFAGRALKNPNLAYALLAEPVDPAVDAERIVFRRRFGAAIARAVSDGVASGDIAPQDPDLTAAALVGAIGEVLVGPLVSAPHSEGVVPELVAFTLRSIGISDAHT